MYTTERVNEHRQHNVLIEVYNRTCQRTQTTQCVNGCIQQNVSTNTDNTTC